jgi:glycosyltransferase involved in cell wall biosynthesis
MRLENLAEELGLGPDRVRFLGFRSDVPDLLAASDFFALPSLTEGLPLSVLEAMGHRLPVIATPVGGVPELVTEGRHGLLVPVDAPESLACAVSQLSQDADLRRRFGEAAYQKVKTDFSFETMLKSYETLYASLLIPRGSRGAERD